MVKKTVGAFHNRVSDIYQKSKRSSIIVYFILRVLIILCMIRQLFQENYLYVLLCVFSLAVMTVPSLLRTTLRIVMPNVFEICIAGFVFAAEILGEISNFYEQFPFWDSMLHTINGFLAAAVGFSLIDLLNSHVKGVQLSPLFIALASFCFSMTIGVLWEFFEFSGDQLFRSDMQKDRIVQTISTVELDPERNNNAIVIDGIAYTVLYDGNGEELAVIEGGYLDVGIIDTMKDLMVNMIGAVVFSVLGYFYTHRREKFQFLENFLISKEPAGSLPEEAELKSR